MTYQEALEYLKECARLGSRPGLTAVSELLRRLGNPQNRLRFIHVAGTNGKGSVAGFIASILTRAGCRTGFFASPAVYSLRETICINGSAISREAFASILSCVRAAADEMPEDGFFHPTEFELLTAAACLFFAEEGCDYAVAEAGLGGRLDATNAIETTAVAVLTKIDYDHQAFLGETLTEIAGEKCGILKKGVPAVVYPHQDEEALSEIRRRAEAAESRLYLPETAALTIHEQSLTGSIFSYKGYEKLRISLCGPHQIDNAVTAIEVVRALAESGFSCPEQALRQGLLQTVWPGRFEVLSREPPMILDGAHNKNGAEAFAKTIETVFPHQPFIGVVGMLRDKDYRACLSAFGRVCSRLIITSVPNPRSAKAQELAKVSESLGLTVSAIADTPEEAVRQAFLHRTDDEGIFCVGSLYALGAYKQACEESLTLNVLKRFGENKRIKE